MIDIETARLNPLEYFERPADVLTAKGLKKNQRIDILRQWEYDARLLEVAAEENMDATDNAHDWLQEIHNALLTLESSSETNPAGSKSG